MDKKSNHGGQSGSNLDNMETLPFEPMVETAKAPCEGLTASPPELGSSDLKQPTSEIKPEATSKSPSSTKHEEQENKKVENQHDGKVDEALSSAHSGGPKAMAEPVPEESGVSKKRANEAENELNKGSGSGQEAPEAKKLKAEAEKPLEKAQAPDLLEMEAWYQ